MEILIVLGIVLTGLLLTKTAFGWTDLDIKTAVFSYLNMKIGYKDGLTRQFLGQLADNTAYNYRHTHQDLFLAGILFENIDTVGTELDFDTDKLYIGSYIEIEFWATYQVWPLPRTVTQAAYTQMYLRLTTTYQQIISDTVYDTVNNYEYSLSMKALDTGGIRIKIVAANVGAGFSDNCYLWGTIKELRYTGPV